MSDKKERNTIITDWLEKHGDPEIDKKVEERLEQITREIMSDKKQSSVEWLEEQLKKGVDFNPLDKNSYLDSVEKIFEQAKAIHAKEIAKAYIYALKKSTINPFCYEHYLIEAEQYYNETFER